MKRDAEVVAELFTKDLLARIDHLERSLRHISKYCIQEPDLAEFALRAAEDPPTAFPPENER